MLKKLLYIISSIILALSAYYAVFYYGIDGFVESVENADLSDSLKARDSLSQAASQF